MNAPKTLNQLHEKLAEALGESPAAIRAENPKWLNLMKEGVLVSLHIGRWRAKTRLTWADLGIQLDEGEDELQEIINLGTKNLLPASLMKELDSIEAGSRKWTEKKSFKTYWGQFLPVSAYQEWKKKVAEFEAAYFAKLDEIVREYDNLINQTLTGYEIAARGAYRRLRSLHPEALRAFKTEEEFTRNFLAGIKGHLATVKEVEKSFYFEVELRYVPLPSLLAEDEAERERIRSEQDTVRSVAWAEQEKHRIEVNTARDAAQAREWMLREMNRDIVEAARKEKTEKIDGFLKDVVVQLRSLVYEATTDILAAMRKKDSLGPRSIVQLKNLVDQVKSLNFYGDAEIDQMISQVNLQVNQNDRDLGQIETNLRDIATITRSSLIGLGESPRLARDLGIATRPTAEMVRTARRGLGLEVAEVMELPVVRSRRLVEV